MVGAEDPVAQEFAFLLGRCRRSASPACSRRSRPPCRRRRCATRPSIVRSAYIAERSPAERSALAAALAAPKSLSKEHLLDVASTLRARAADQAHLDAGETGDVDLAVELIEERPPAEQAEMLEAMRRGDPAKARAVQAALISDQSFERVSDDVLTAAAMAVPTEVLGRFLRDVPEAIAVARAVGAAANGGGVAPGGSVAGRRADTAADFRGAANDVRVAAQGVARPRSLGAEPVDRERIG